MKVYFADTSYYIALLVPHDQAHHAAVRFAADASCSMVTTDYVLIELSAFFAKAPLRGHFVALVDRLRSAPELTIVRTSDALFDRGWETYRQHADKDWSLTDCISFPVMRDLEISESLTSDHHLEHAGYAALLNQS